MKFQPDATGHVRLSDLNIDEDYWPKGSTEIIRRWLAENYNHETMPTLACATVRGKEGIWLLGWNQAEGEEPLFRAIFGRDMTDEESARATAVRELSFGKGNDLPALDGGHRGEQH